MRLLAVIALIGAMVWGIHACLVIALDHELERAGLVHYPR